MVELNNDEKNVLWLRINEYSKTDILKILKITDKEFNNIFKGIADKIQTVDDTIQMNKLLENYK